MADPQARPYPGGPVGMTRDGLFAGAMLEYHSPTLSKWVLAKVVEVAADGAFQVDVKLGHWFTRAEYDEKFRVVQEGRKYLSTPAVTRTSAASSSGVPGKSVTRQMPSGVAQAAGGNLTPGSLTTTAGSLTSSSFTAGSLTPGSLTPSSLTASTRVITTLTAPAAASAAQAQAQTLAQGPAVAQAQGLVRVWPPQRTSLLHGSQSMATLAAAPRPQGSSESTSLPGHEDQVSVAAPTGAYRVPRITSTEMEASLRDDLCMCSAMSWM